MCHNGLRDPEGLQHNKEIKINLYCMKVRHEMVKKGTHKFLFVAASKVQSLVKNDFQINLNHHDILCMGLPYDHFC